MSMHFSCKCEERKKPVEERRWVVRQYRCNHSAFNGYRHANSDYSSVECLSCGAWGRTKAAYVEKLKVENWK